MENKEIRLHVQLTEKDYLKFQKDHMGTSKSKIWWVYGGIILIVILFLNIQNCLKEGFAGVNFTMLLPFLVFGFVMTVAILSVKAKTKSAFKSDPTLNNPMEIIINNEGITLNCYRSTTNPLWENIYRYSLTKDTIYIYTAQNKSIIIPLRAFENESDMDAVVSLLKNKVDQSKHQKDSTKTKYRRWILTGLLIIVVFSVTFFTGSGEIDLQSKAWDLENRQDYKGAAAIYSQLIIDNPNKDTYYGYRAKCEIELSDYKSAIKDCEKALSIQSSGWAYYTYSYALYYDERYQDACVAINKSIELGYIKDNEGLCDPPEN